LFDYRFFCVSADAAADLASLLAVLLRRTEPAELATLALVFSLLPFWVSADAATAFSAFDADLSFKTLAAAEATLLPVLTLLAMGHLLWRRDSIDATYRVKIEQIRAIPIRTRVAKTY
jgi:hypothetical protein